MIAAKIRITGMEDIAKTLPKAQDGVRKLASECAEASAELQEQLILSGRAPDGSEQQSVSRSTIERKKGTPNVALWRTGKLADASQWIIKTTARGVKLTVPRGRRKAALALIGRGFKIIIGQPLPRQIVELAERGLDRIGAKL